VDKNSTTDDIVKRTFNCKYIINDILSSAAHS